MNREAMLKTAQYIREHPEHFDMGQWCGTKFCIAGAAVLAYGGEPHPAASLVRMPWDDKPTDVEYAAREILGLTREEGHHLFLGHVLKKALLLYVGHGTMLRGPEEARRVAKVLEKVANGEIPLSYGEVPL